MSTFFENNIWLLLLSVGIAAVTWLYCKRVENIRLRRAIRATIIFLIIPVFNLGHPFLFYQAWVLLIASIVNIEPMWFLIYLAVWGLFVGVSQVGIKNENKAI